jgi:phosphoenolpyruvate-protein kinase (PTS system EI component)
MLEVPSACLQARDILREADFASIGTNDLIQYLFAVDRNNEMVAADFRSDRALLWRLIEEIASAARDLGKELSVCGELGGDPKYTGRLVAAGIRTVSVTARRIPTVRTAAAAATRGGAVGSEPPRIV